MLKALEKKKMTVVTFKLTLEELMKFKRLAHKYAGGNTSSLIRHAVLNFKPDKSDLSE